MDNHKQIPDIIISRLPIYVRALQYMQHTGRQNTSSQEMGELLNISAAQLYPSSFGISPLPTAHPLILQH